MSQVCITCRWQRWGLHLYGGSYCHNGGAGNFGDDNARWTEEERGGKWRLWKGNKLVQGRINYQWSRRERNVASPKVLLISFKTFICLHYSLFPSLILEFAITWAGTCAGILRQKYGLQLISLANPSSCLCWQKREPAFELSQLHWIVLLLQRAKQCSQEIPQHRVRLFR